MFTFWPPVSNEILPAKSIAAALSRELFRSVEVDKGLQDDSIYLVPHGASPMLQLRSLGLALHATLSATPSGYRISRTPSDLENLSAVRGKERARWYESRFKELNAFRDSHAQSLRSASDLAYDLDAEFKRLQEVASGSRPESQIPPLFSFQLMPGEALLEGLLKRIGVDYLANIPSNSVETYEDRPVTGSKPLPNDADLLAGFLADRKSVV